MAHKSTGVFRVPVSENGIIPTALNIMLNNDSRCHTSNVTVTVKRSRNTFFQESIGLIVLMLVVNEYRKIYHAMKNEKSIIIKKL
ncbi:hypothetical protein [Bacillus sp. NH11B]|uniref:hypothetical protein n=1 Tax=Bacillus sp. NH11B TaxID=1866314 RepID=UPI0008FDB18F|nr:hypothetical protein [Bacillus sp. NH11B]OJD59458.1 hypothetical protein BAU27_14870 [Bacillus sp. NH11B]